MLCLLSSAETLRCHRAKELDHVTLEREAVGRFHAAQITKAARKAAADEERLALLARSLAAVKGQHVGLREENEHLNNLYTEAIGPPGVSAPTAARAAHTHATSDART